MIFVLFENFFFLTISNMCDLMKDFWKKSLREWEKVVLLHPLSEGNWG